MSSLDRFIQAQDAREAGIDAALRELRAGRKRGHWIWYVFPQLRGLGRSDIADYYAIADRHEAEAYLHDPVLRRRLSTAASAALDQVRSGAPLSTLMGSSVDTLKLVSSMTLFAQVARHIEPTDAADECSRLAGIAEELLDAAATEGYPRCAFTEAALAAAEHGRFATRHNSGGPKPYE